MPFPRSAQVKGGKAPSTESQKAAAKAWAIANCPWQNSTGPRTPEGKAITSSNPERAYFKRTVKFWQCPDLAAFEAECSQIERAIGRMREVVEALPPGRGFEFSSLKRTSPKSSDRPWKRYTVRINLLSWADDDPVVKQCWEKLKATLEVSEN